MLKINRCYEKDIQQRCAKAISAFNSNEMPVVAPITKELKLRVYLSAIRPTMMYGSETWAAPSTVMERLHCTERKLLRRLHGVCRIQAGRGQLATNGSSGLRIWNNDEWIDFVQALTEDREGWAELCSRTIHLGEDEGNRVSRDISPPIKSAERLKHLKLRSVL
ncbi:hypothetical protein RB195_005030 [Necator americanus]|uniref:Uncharacterized protein n=1 Tax=Necator americanus TaxID=51031 RepID=A0ABR1BPQ8_NECAM